MNTQDWRKFLIPYSQAVQEMKVKFENIMMEYRNMGEYSPIEQVLGRVKSISSILEKMARQDIEYEDLEDRLSDIAGLRIICQFVEDIDVVVGLIRSRKDMEVLEETNYVDHKKKSGYRSYHIVVRYPVYTVYGPKDVKAEIQIRTLGMNFWSIIEHSLSYKYNGVLPGDVTDRLSSAAEAAFAMDKEMSTIRNDIMDAQGMFQANSKELEDIMNNIQNIYLAGEKMAMKEAQEQLLRMVKNRDAEKIHEFSNELDQVAQHHQIQKIES